MEGNTTYFYTGLGFVLYTWIMVVGLSSTSTSFRTLSEKQKAIRMRTKFKWVFWPIYVPVFVVCWFFYMIFKALRGVVRAVDDAKFFKKIDSIGHRKGNM